MAGCSVGRRKTLLLAVVSSSCLLLLFFASSSLTGSRHVASRGAHGPSSGADCAQCPSQVSAPACAPVSSRVHNDSATRRLQPFTGMSERQSALCRALGLPADAELWVTGNMAWERYLTPQFAFTIRALVEHNGFVRVSFGDVIHAHRTWLESAGALTELDALRPVTGRTKLPSAVIVWEFYEAPAVVAWLRSFATVFFVADDLQYFKEEQRTRRASTYASAHVVFSTYAYVFRRFYSELAALPVKWVPHAASPDFLFDDIESNTHPVALLSGAVGDAYPLRQLAARVAQQDSRIVTLSHPGYAAVDPSSNETIVGRRYALRVRQFRAAITCGAVYNYAVAKVVEVPATGAVLIVSRPLAPVLARMGLRDNEHYVSYEDEPSLLHALDVALSTNPAVALQVDQMRRRAQLVVLERHTTGTRARQMADEVRLWAAAWHARSSDDADAASCWDALVASSTGPGEGPEEEPRSLVPPSAARFEQVNLLSRSFYEA